MNSTVPALGDLPDDDLMCLVTQGVVEGPIAELFDRHNRALYNFLVWSCQGDRDEAADLCQKTWLKLMRCAHYQPAASFRAFLHATARNALIDLRRSAYGDHLPLDEQTAEPPADDLSPEAEFCLKQRAEDVRRALMALPAVQREAVVLRFFSELSLAEIADVAGVGGETVKSRLRYAFSRLRQILEPSTS